MFPRIEGRGKAPVISAEMRSASRSRTVRSNVSPRMSPALGAQALVGAVMDAGGGVGTEG